MNPLDRLRKEIIDCEKILMEDLFVEEYNIWFESKKYIDNVKQPDLSRIGVGTVFNTYRPGSSPGYPIGWNPASGLEINNNEENINVDTENDTGLNNLRPPRNSRSGRMAIISTPLGTNGRIGIGTPNSHDQAIGLHMNMSVIRNEERLRYFNDLISGYLITLKNFNKIKDYKIDIYDSVISHHPLYNEYNFLIPFKIIKKRLFFNKKILISIRINPEESDNSVIRKLNERMTDNGIEF